MEFKSLIIVIVVFKILIVAWSRLLSWIQITLWGGVSILGHFVAMTSLSRFSEEAAFSIPISSSVFILLWLISSCIRDIVSSIVFISYPSLRTCSEKKKGYIYAKTI